MVRLLMARVPGFATLTIGILASAPSKSYETSLMSSLLQIYIQFYQP